MNMFEPKAGQIAGFDIIGYRQRDGKVKLGDENGELVNDFPEEIQTPYGVFTLETIKKNDEDNTLPEDHPGKNIEWGIYV